MARGISAAVIRLRNTAPPFVRRGLDRLIASETGPIAWAKDKALVRGEIPPAPIPRTDKAIRLLIAPLNYAGQGYEWARTASSANVEATNLGVRVGGSFQAASDWTLSAEVFTASRVWRARQRAALPKFTHVMIESFASPLGRGTGDVIADDIDWLTRSGVRVALLCHGTDVRQPSHHMSSHPFSPFRDASPSALAAAERSARTNAQIARDFDGPVFVSTPDLLADVPGAQWLPIVVEAPRWHSEHPADAQTPVVLHVPSAGPVKGTDHVDRIAQSLSDAGVLEYRRMQGVPAPKMPGHVGSADIVVDQLLLGSYGVAACEALAAGRVVVGNVDDDVRAYIRDVTGADVPIVQADPETLDAVLRALAADPDERERIAALGPAYIARVHSGEWTSKALVDYLVPLG